ncbi:MAG: phage tail protein [Eubacterium sp.]|nr:phage tail protein [Eubacterium sp.]
MSELKAPEINISFKEKGASAITRGSRGIVLLAVKDKIIAPLKNPVTVTSTGDIPSTLDDTTKAQIKLALIGYQTAPIKVLVYGMGIDKSAESEAVGNAYTAAQKAWKDIKFDYLAIPTVSTDGKTQEIVTWVKSMRTAKKRIKAVLPNVAADTEGVINYTINKNVYVETITNQDGTTSRVTTDYTAEQYCGRIAGLLCGTPLTISATYAPLGELEDCERVEDIDAAVGKGEFVVFYDGEKVKTSRAVNSFTTTVQGKGDSYKKCKIVDCMDLIADDLTTAIQDNYLGKYANSYDNKCVLIAAIKMYFKQLSIDGIVSNDFSVDFDIEAIKVYLIGKGKYTEEELAAMDDTAIAKLDTGSRVFIKANATILDAMEDVDLPIEI